VTVNGTNTIVVTGTSTTGATNIVEVYGVGISPAASTVNPVVVAVSPNPQNNANSALVPTYAGFVSANVSTVSGDGMNVYYADTGSALLKIATAVNLPYTLTSTTQAIPGWVTDVGVSYAGLGKNTPLTLVGSSPTAGQYSVSAGSYTINAADEGIPLIISATVNCGANSVTTLAANCYSDGLIHPNNEGHQVMTTVILATIPAAKINGAITAYHPPQLQTVSAPLLPTNPSQFWTPNPYNTQSSGGWTPGVGLSYINGNASGITYQPATGTTLYFANIGSPAAVSMCPTLGGAGKQGPGPPPSLASCFFQLTSNGIITMTGSVKVGTLTITQSGLTGTIVLPVAAIAAGACGAVASLNIGGSGVSGTTAFAWSFNADPTGIAGYGNPAGIVLELYGTSNAINVKQCNLTSASITPGAATINVRGIF
jgi:hypothetical protein